MDEDNLGHESGIRTESIMHLMTGHYAISNDVKGLIPPAPSPLRLLASRGGGLECSSDAAARFRWPFLSGRLSA